MFVLRKSLIAKAYVIIGTLSTMAITLPATAQTAGQATSSSILSLFQSTVTARRPNDCGLPFSENNDNGRLPRLSKGGASVFERNGDSSVFVTIRELRVNTDGSPISYHPFDLHGQGEQRKQYGVGKPNGRQPVLNRSCNAVIWAFDGRGPAYCRSKLPAEKDADYQKRMMRYYRLVERTRDKGWPDLLTRGPGYPTIDQSWTAIQQGAEEIPSDGFVQFDPRVILMTKPVNGRRYPCIRKTGKYTGYFVNQTALDWLVGKTPAEDDASDPAQERDCKAPIKVDPTKIPALVIPTGGPYEQGNRI